MTALIQLSNGAAAKGLILGAAGDRLGDEEVKRLDHALLFTSKIWVGFGRRGEFGCAWGLIPPTILSETAYLWLYHIEEVVTENQFVFVRKSQRMVEEMLEEYPRITGYCQTSKPSSIRWLRWLGASFGEPGEKVVPFVIRKKKRAD